jgi:hypothetical protein
MGEGLANFIFSNNRGQSAGDGACPIILCCFGASTESGDFFHPVNRTKGMPFKSISRSKALESLLPPHRRHCASQGNAGSARWRATCDKPGEQGHRLERERRGPRRRAVLPGLACALLAPTTRRRPSSLCSPHRRTPPCTRETLRFIRTNTNTCDREKRSWQQN